MEDYKYTAKDFEIKWTVKLHNYFAGLFARKDLLREFCINNGIDYKPKANQKYAVPAEYIFSHSEIKYLSGIRDKIILAYYEDYKNKQLDIVQEIQKTNSDIKVENEILETEKATLTKYKNSLKNTKDPQARITLQNLVEVTKTKIDNEKIQLAEKEQNLENYKSINISNIENWQKQIDIVDNIFEIQKACFDKNISKKIAKYLNYTKVHSNIGEYGDSVKKILKGGVYDEK